LLYEVGREAIRRSDCAAMELVVRKSVSLFVFTHKHKYTLLNIYCIANQLTRPYRAVEQSRYNRTVNLTGKKNQNAAVDKLIEDLQGGNGGVKSMVRAGSTDQRYKDISLCVLRFKEAIDEYHVQVKHARSIAKKQNTDREKARLIEAFIDLGMFKLDGKALPLADHFSTKLRGGLAPKTAHQRHLDIEEHARPSMEKSIFNVVMHFKERELAILATQALKRYSRVIGVDPVEVRLEVVEGTRDKRNPASVWNYVTEGCPEASPQMPTIDESIRSIDAALFSEDQPKWKLAFQHQFSDKADLMEEEVLAGDRVFQRNVPAIWTEVPADRLVTLPSFGVELLLHGVWVSLTKKEACALAEKQWEVEVMRENADLDLAEKESELKQHEAELHDLIRTDVKAAEERLRWARSDTPLSQAVKPRLMTSSDARRHVREGKDVIQCRVVSADISEVAVDAWSGRLYKTLYSSRDSLFASTLGTPPVADPVYNHASSVKSISRVGGETAKYLGELGLRTLGDLIRLREENDEMKLLEVIVVRRGKKIPYGWTLRKLVAAAVELVEFGLPDVGSEDEEEEIIGEYDLACDEEGLD